MEHMAFDGVGRYSRGEISGWVDDVGGFLNTFAGGRRSSSFSWYRPSIRERSRQLSPDAAPFRFPPREIEKERKVISRRSAAKSGTIRAPRSRIVDRRLYRGSLLTESVAGYPAAIEAMSECRPEDILQRKLPTVDSEVVVTRLRPEGGERFVDRCFPAGSGARCAASLRPAWGRDFLGFERGRRAAFDNLVPVSRGRRAASPRRSSSRECSGKRGLPARRVARALSVPEAILEIPPRILRPANPCRCAVEGAELPRAAARPGG